MKLVLEKNQLKCAFFIGSGRDSCVGIVDSSVELKLKAGVWFLRGFLTTTAHRPATAIRLGAPLVSSSLRNKMLSIESPAHHSELLKEPTDSYG